LKNIPLSKIWIDTRVVGFIIDSLIINAREFTALEEFGIWYPDVGGPVLLTAAEAIRRKVKVLRFSATGHPAKWNERNEPPSVFDSGVSEFVHKFTSLDTLVLDHLELDVDAKHHSNQSSLTWIPEVLKRLSSPIRRLVFEVSAKEISELDAIPWMPVDEIVANPESVQFRSLDRVEILVERKGSPDGGSFLKHRDTLYQEFKPLLPQIARMGLLRCSFVSLSGSGTG